LASCEAGRSLFGAPRCHPANVSRETFASALHLSRARMFHVKHSASFALSLAALFVRDVSRETFSFPLSHECEKHEGTRSPLAGC
ncbi:MAG: hypothetical protein ACLS6R_10555, partial [Eggerthella lenta]